MMSKGTFVKGFIFAGCLVMSILQTDFSLWLLWERGGRFFSMAGEMFPPDTQFLTQVLAPLRDTLFISLMGTGLGAFIGFAGTVLCNSYVNRNNALRAGIKTAVHLVRCIPVLILALLCTFLFGLGVWPGVAAITVSTGAVLTRLGYEDSENADLRTARALEFTGGGRLKAFLSSVWRQVLPGYISNLLYLLESNVRNAAVLGFVGAGGIGLLLNEKLAWREYPKVGMMLCALYIVVSGAEYLSEFLRKNLRDEKAGMVRGYEITFLLFSVICGLFFLLEKTPEKMNWKAFQSILAGVVSPDVTMLCSLQSGDVPALLYETFCIAFLGTVGGTICALFFSVFASFRIFGKAAFPVRMLLLLFRAVPVLVFGLLWIRVTGPGAFAGVLTLTVCSVGFLAKRFLIAVDSIDFGPYEALRAMGTPLLPALRWGLVPQLLPHYVSAVLYRLDINLRESAALGLVGAGGIGTTLVLAMNHYEWSQTGSMLWGLIILVAVVGVFSETYRKTFRLRALGSKQEK